MGYTKSEIDKWVTLRDPLSHADKKSSATILLEADVTPIIWRVRQAAYDVLLNKKIWCDRNSERRNIWDAGCYSSDEQNNYVIRDGAKQIGFYVTDPYNVYTRIGIEFNGIPDNLYVFKPKNSNA